MRKGGRLTALQQKGLLDARPPDRPTAICYLFDLPKRLRPFAAVLSAAATVDISVAAVVVKSASGSRCP